MMRKLLIPIVCVCLCLTTAAARAGGATWIRLVDARKNVPLEFWEKTDDLRGEQSTLHWRMSTAVYIDGKALPYGHYGKDTGAVLGAGGDGEKVEGMAEIEKELGMSAPEEAQVRSDRLSLVVGGTGTKAAVGGEFADGEHTLYPGGLKFTLAKGAVTAVAGALAKTGPAAMSLRCTAVDINSPGTPAPVTVTQGGLKVFDAVLSGAGAQVLRLFLPVSAEDYSVRLGAAGEVRLRVAEDGLQLQGTPALAAGFAADVRGFTLAVYSTALPAPATATVTPAAAVVTGAPELYLFTDRNRTVFGEGELVQLSVRAYGPATAGDRVVLVLEGTGGKLELPPQALKRGLDAAAAAAEIELDTALLGPGVYRLQGAWGATAANPLELRIVSVLPVTNLKLFGYNKWGSSSFDPKDLAAAERNGLNLVVQGGGGGQGGHVMATNASPFSDWGGRTTRPIDALQLPAGPRAHVPPELLDAPNEHDAGAEFLLAHGIQNVPVACNLILYFNVGAFWQDHADDRNQAVQQLGQEWRRFPNFLGIVHCTGDGPTPATIGMVWAAGAGSFDIIHDERMKKLREVFEFKVGKVKIDDSSMKAEFERINQQMRGAIGFGVGMNTGMDVQGDDAVKLEWNKWVNDLYPACFREERKALAALMPDPIVNCSWTWGGGIGGGMWAETFYRSLDNVVSDLHGDYGIVPLAYSSGADTLGFSRPGRPWQSLDLLPERPFANGMKLFLEGLSRNPAGIGALNTRKDVAGGWGDGKEPSEGMSVLMDLGRRFGDLFMGLERRDEIAIIGSMRQAALGGQSPGILYGAHFLATKAGYQPNVISEDDVLREPARLQRFKAVFLVSMTTALPAELRTALAAFQKQGGRVIADEASKVDLPDVIRVKVIELNGANEVNFRNVYNSFEPLIKSFRAAVTPQLAPFFTTTMPHVHLVRSTDGDLEYWTVFNDTLLSPEENPNGHFIQFLYKGVESDLAAARGGVLYDAFRRQPVAGADQPVKDRLAWHGDMRFLPGTVYLCADRPIAALRAAVVPNAMPGELLSITAQALDAAGREFTGRLPVEITLTDPAGAVRQRVYRTTNREVLLKLAWNDPAGTWRWAVADQATGLVAKGTIIVHATVDATAMPPVVKPLDDLVYDAPAVFSALHGREFDIVLYPGQLALAEPAKALAERLRQAGAKAAVRILWPSVVRPFPMNWKDFTVEDEEIHEAVLRGDVVGLRVRGKNQEGGSKSDPMKYAFYGHYTGSAEIVYCRDVILFGRGDAPSNPMMDLITQRCRMLPRNPSATFPAPGFGLVAYAWAPFHYGHDAIVVYGQDAAGLARAGDALVKLAAAKDAPPPARLPRTAGPKPENGSIYSGFGLAAGAQATAPAPVISREGVAENLLPPVFDLRVTEAATRGDRVFAKLRSGLDTKAPPFAVVDLGAGTARRFNSADRGVRDAGLEPLERGETGTWSSGLVRRVADGRILRVGKGLARVDAQNSLQWYCDPFAVPANYSEAKYPRRLQQFTVSPDEQWILAVFYDLGAGCGYGPAYRIFNDGATVLLEAKTGREVCRAPGFLAKAMALAADGARFIVVDNVDFDNGGRGPWNSYGGPTIAAFDRTGKELCHFPGDNVQDLVASRDATLAVVTYADPRRYASIIDVVRGRETRVSYPRIDVGTAVAPDGSFAVVAYADGMLRKFAPDGKLLQEWKLAAPGAPAVTDKGAVMVCGHDGRLYFPGTERAPLAVGTAPAEDLKVSMEPLTPGLVAPGTPWWTTLTGTLKPEPLPAPAGAATLAKFQGDKTLALDVPKLAPADVALLTFSYRLPSPKDTLTVAFEPTAGHRVTELFPYFAQARSASVALRLKTPGQLSLTFSALGGAEIADVALLRLKCGGLANVGQTSMQKKSANPNSPRVMVPNVHGALGDPRVEQVAFGWPAKGSNAPLPADLQGKGTPVTEGFALFDGNVYAGTVLYPTVFPGAAAWNPPQALNTLRSAQVILEFAKPCAAEAVAVWEQPGDRPVTAFTLEYATSADVKAGEKAEIPGDWKLALEVRDNSDYFQARTFAKPITARVWRYTIVDTPCAVQRLAEIELFQSAVDALEGDMNLDGGGAGGSAAEPGGL